MHTLIYATSKTLTKFLQQVLQSDSGLGMFFNSADGGNMTVSTDSPHRMMDENSDGLSVWLYRVVRDDNRLNAMPERPKRNIINKESLPVRLHYLLTPLVNNTERAGSDTEQIIFGKVLQSLHDNPRIRGSQLKGDFQGTSVELNVHMETLSLDDMTTIWSVISRPFRLSVSYEISVVSIASAREPDEISPVEVVIPEKFGVITGGD